MNKNLQEINRKIDALFIVVSCPPWPDREFLSSWGQSLYDDMREYVKTYLLDDDKKRSTAWGTMIFHFIHEAKIIDQNEFVKSNNKKLLKVFLYYTTARTPEFKYL